MKVVKLKKLFYGVFGKRILRIKLYVQVILVKVNNPIINGIQIHLLDPCKFYISTTFYNYCNNKTYKITYYC